MLGSPGVAGSLLGQPVLNLGRQLALRGEEGGDWPYWHSLFGIPDDGQETDVSAASAALSWLVDGGTAMEQGAKSLVEKLEQAESFVENLALPPVPPTPSRCPNKQRTERFRPDKESGDAGPFAVLRILIVIFTVFTFLRALLTQGFRICFQNH